MSVAWVGAAAAVGGAYIGSQGAKSAANTQAGAANNATAAQEGMFNKTVDLNSPFRSNGVAASNRLNTLLGIGNPNGTTPVDPASVPTTYQAGQSGDPLWEQILKQYNDASTAKFGAPMSRSWDADADAQNQYQQLKQQYLSAKGSQQAAAAPSTPDPAYGSLLKPFSMSDFQMDPGIQFQTQQGNLALTNSSAAKNGVLSGGALKDFISYNQGMAGTGYQSAYDRYMANKQLTLSSLMDVSGLGQSAASNTGNNAATMSNGIAGTITGAGNAGAAGQVGSANALTTGINGAANSYTLSRLLNNGSSSDLGGPITTSANPGGVYLANAA